MQGATILTSPLSRGGHNAVRPPRPALTRDPRRPPPSGPTTRAPRAPQVIRGRGMRLRSGGSNLPHTVLSTGQILLLP